MMRRRWVSSRLQDIEYGQDMELHRPVMPVEVLEHLAASRGGLFVDGTLGLGGHTELILRASPENRVIGFDRDTEAITLAKERLADFGDRFKAVHADYRSIKETLESMGTGPVAGILADLGISSYQLDNLERGFSFRTAKTGPTGISGTEADSPLDMRMDRTQGLTAADLVNGLSERELADIIYQFGEERAARRIARRIVGERAKTAIKTTAQLADIVIRAIHQKGYWRIHPATRTFQALRIAVNRELDGLDKFVADAVESLEPDGRLVVITFHSLEDRIIKKALRYQSGQCRCEPDQPGCICGAVKRVEIITRKAIEPGEKEIADNPRARSAKLRACRKFSA